MAVLCVGLATATAARTASAQEATAVREAALDAAVVDDTLVITAGSSTSMRVAARPGRGTGPTIRCTWFSLAIDPVTVSLVQEDQLVVDQAYLLWCWYPADDGTRASLPGHPLVRTYTGPGIPGDPADVDDVSEFALASLRIAQPEVATNPGDQQIVGIDTWLAVSSNLEYEPIHANAGPVWTSVRPVPHSISWDMGNDERTTCPPDAAAFEPWADTATDDPECRYRYESRPVAADGVAGETQLTATVTWRVMRRTFLEPEWTYWRDLELSGARSIEVIELQTVTF